MNRYRVVAVVCFALMGVSIAGAAVANSFDLAGPAFAFAGTAVVSLGLGLAALGQDDDEDTPRVA
jgi:hypothetical protein